MAFFEDIADLYEETARTLLKDWSSLRKKLVTLESRKMFLTACRRRKLIPRHIKQNFGSIYGMLIFDHPYKRCVDRVIAAFKNKCLNLEIWITFWKISQIQSSIRIIIEKVSSILPHVVIQNFIFMQDRSFGRLNHRLCASLNKKLDDLDENRGVLRLEENSDWLFNCTAVTLPFNVCSLLALGPKFIAPQKAKNISFLEILKDVENIVQEEASSEIRDEKRALCSNIITNFMSRTWIDRSLRPIDHHLIDLVKETKVFLRSHPEIIISKADKGNRTVVLYKSEYEGKMVTIVEDENTYMLLIRDPTISLQKEANKIISSLFRKNYISKDQKDSLSKYNCVPPKLYGLCKIHKQGFPLRPIVSFVGSPGYNISKFVSNILSNLNPMFTYSIKNSTELLDRIGNIVVPDDHVLISFDAESLYTNVKKELVLELIRKYWHLLEDSTSLDLGIVVELVEFCFRCSYVSFMDCFYRQISGCPMGAPCSSLFAILVMHFILSEVQRRLDSIFLILLVYVDDIFAIIPKDSVQRVLSIFNSIVPEINFTYELEDLNHSLPFLDVRIFRDLVGGRLSTDLYRKPTSTSRTINFNSLHPLHQKINIITQSKLRITNLCSVEFREKNFTHLREDLHKNGYPARLINSVLNSHTPNPRRENAPSEQTNVKHFKLLSVPGLSSQLKSVLNKENFKIISYSKNTLNNLVFSCLKDKTPKKFLSNVIYKIKCCHCEKCYIGTTKQHLTSRISNHRSSCTTISNQRTALVEHHLATGHSFDFNIDNVEVLHREDNYRKRLFAEMFYIKRSNSCVNFRSDLDNLSSIYNVIINRCNS
ncbi:uncharacterized protein LOC123317749 [Coccinella septempunctata]|uniref:uncharacterized protein LOC123317749 n=1 Tax=Coccinella septempunctata TaxID=41139 RepID=UPI001D08FA9D|nr:uncharacterized protein LOC123317749 [Coccinella septempunctata]